ncbi:alpha/beta fold hydrolase [SAR92 clade bacterium H246]
MRDYSSALGFAPLPNTGPEAIAVLLHIHGVLKERQKTAYEVKGTKGIEALEAVEINGRVQHLHIRGRNRNNPVLLYLHGGPGAPMIGWMDAIQRPWEDYFTVVHWDQRQTGKSYYPADDTQAPLSVDDFIKDTEEVVQYLLGLLGKNKLVVLGHSWGSVLGMHLVKHHPQWLYAYIGLGQVVESSAAEKMLYQRLIDRALEHNEPDLAEQISQLLPMLDADFPVREKTFAEYCAYVRKHLSRLSGEAFMHNCDFDDALQLIAFSQCISPHISYDDMANKMTGDEVALFRPPYHFTKQVLDVNLPKTLGVEFQVPLFFFTGVYDWQTPKVLSDKWLEKITAPHKQLVEFKDSSHLVINEEPGRFLSALVNHVLPYCESGDEET